MPAVFGLGAAAVLTATLSGGDWSAAKGIVLGVLQGLTEFLPISSSGHLQILTWLAGWDELTSDAALWTVFEVALHFGTFAGAVVYFGRDVGRLITGGLRQAAGRRSEDGKLAWKLVLASVPVGLVGVAAGSWLAEREKLWVTACALAFFGAALWAADRWASGRAREIGSFGWADAVWLGLAQVLALQPGVSRSGVVMTAGRLRGLSRPGAAKVALLMSLPVIAGAAVYKLIDIGGFSGIPQEARWAFLWGALAAAISGWAAVWLLMKAARKVAFWPFALYRLALAAVVLSLLAASFRGTSWG